MEEFDLSISGQKTALAMQQGLVAVPQLPLFEIPKLLYEEFKMLYGCGNESNWNLGRGEFFRFIDIAVANCYLCHGSMGKREYLLLIDEDPERSLATTIHDLMLMSVVVKPTSLGVGGSNGELYQDKLFVVTRKKSIALQYAYSRLMFEIGVRAYLLGECALEVEPFLVNEGDEPFHCNFSYERILFGENG